jgi:hypothetical protein
LALLNSVSSRNVPCFEDHIDSLDIFFNVNQQTSFFFFNLI